MKAPSNQITCPVCQKGFLTKKSKLRYGGAGASIGLIFLIPSCFTLIILFSSMSEMNLDATEEADAIAMGVIGMGFILPAIFFFLLGLFLCRSVKVLRCGFCGANQDAD